MNSTPVLEGYGVRLLPLRREHLGALQQTHDASTWQWMSESGATPELMAAFVDRALALAEVGSAQAWACVHGQGQWPSRDRSLFGAVA